ncbi:unnamed protein product [Caenorhabditis bovis]|uniref:RING-type domain-containing protein n=1 Tax=Caenorhabditis bovis TaxID=2654633 RepID=A0A8S1FFI0_9PELO|nr:unnamed protein product [Caenorhabditis bovis]
MSSEENESPENAGTPIVFEDSPTTSVNEAKEKMEINDDDSLKSLTGDVASTSSNAKEDDECAICRGEILDCSRLDGCSHEFCFECISRWCSQGSTALCPMCKAKVTMITHKLDTDTPLTTTVESLKRSVRPLNTGATPIVSEKRVINVALRAYRRSLAEVDIEIDKMESGVRRRNSQALQKLEESKRFLVGQVNGLHMLKEDVSSGVPKNFILSKLEFRMILYSGIIPVKMLGRSTWTFLSDQQLRENREHFRSVVVQFLTEELKAVPVANKKPASYMDRVVTYVSSAIHIDSEFVNNLYDVICDLGNTVSLKEYLIKKLNISNVNAETLLRQIYGLIASRKSFLEFCNETRYEIERETVSSVIPANIWPIISNRHSNRNNGSVSAYITLTRISTASTASMALSAATFPYVTSRNLLSVVNAFLALPTSSSNASDYSWSALTSLMNLPTTQTQALLSGAQQSQPQNLTVQPEPQASPTIASLTPPPLITSRAQSQPPGVSSQPVVRIDTIDYENNDPDEVIAIGDDDDDDDINIDGDHDFNVEIVTLSEGEDANETITLDDTPVRATQCFLTTAQEAKLRSRVRQLCVEFHLSGTNGREYLMKAIDSLIPPAENEEPSNDVEEVDDDDSADQPSTSSTRLRKRLRRYEEPEKKKKKAASSSSYTPPRRRRRNY